MNSELSLEALIDHNHEHRRLLLTLGNQILKLRLDHLSELREHYKEYWLDADLKYYEAKMNWLLAKEKFATYQSAIEKVDKELARLKQEATKISEQTVDLTSKLEPYKKLDPNLLAEFKSLKDDLECQDMIIQIGASNRST